MIVFRPILPAWLLFIAFSPFGQGGEAGQSDSWQVHWREGAEGEYLHFYDDRETILEFVLWTDPRWSYDLRMSLHQRGGNLTARHNLTPEERSLIIPSGNSWITSHTLRWESPEVKGPTEFIVRLDGKRTRGEVAEVLPGRTLTLWLHPTVQGKPLAGLTQRGYMLILSPDLREWSPWLIGYGATVRTTPPQDQNPGKLIYLATSREDWPESSPRSHHILIFHPERGNQETIYFVGPGQPTRAIIRLPDSQRKVAHPILFNKLQTLFRVIETSRPPHDLLP